MSQLKNKVVICTGAGRAQGLGAGILRRMAEEGCKVVVTDLGKPDQFLADDDIGATDEMNQIADELRGLTGDVLAVPCDVRKEADVRNLMDTTVSEFGRVDVLVNNAGIGYMLKPFSEVSLEEWQIVIDVNLTGAFLCAKYAALEMIRQGHGGRIINIASQAAKSGFPDLAAYVSSKHGMVGMTRALATELGEHQITVNAVCPNHVTTGLGARQNEYYAQRQNLSLDEFMSAMRARIPLGRPGLVTDTAAAVAFLASDDAQYITGEAMNVSGGEETH